MKWKLTFRWILAVVIIVPWLHSAPATKHERWKIKTSYAVAPVTAKTINLSTLETLGEPLPGQPKPVSKYAATLLPGKFHGFKEGDFVQTTAWLHLAAFSADDSDYHLQVTRSKTSGNNCVIVEIPDPRNAPNKETRTQWENARKFIDSLCGNKRPSEGGKPVGPLHVRVTGQLFYDLSHETPGSRGKNGMKAITSWEVHPVWKITIQH